MGKNNIQSTTHGSQVTLDPDFLLGHALYLPSGETISTSNMTLGQAIAAIALAHIKTRTPQLAGKCNAATVTFADGKFTVSFADSIDHLSF